MTDGGKSSWGNPDWRDDFDEGFPIPNEDRKNEVHVDDLGGAWVCVFIEGLGWAWTDFNTWKG